MAGYELCIVIPTLNERDNVPVVLQRLAAALDGIDYEVIFVDDDSSDGTSARVRNAAACSRNVRVLQRIGRRGLASACIEGMLATAAPFVAVMDGDGQHDERILPEMLRHLRSGTIDLAVGSRNREGGSMGDFSPMRVALSGMGRRLSGVSRHAELTDPMSGFFAVRRDFFQGLAHQLTGTGFKILLDIVLSAKGRVRIAEVPYRFGARQHGSSKLNLLVGLEYMELLLDKALGHYLPIRFVLFGLVGLVGVGMHLLLLALLLHASRGAFVGSQAYATAVVMVLNYVLNNAITFRTRARRGWQFWTGMFSFCLACSVGLVANLAISNQAYRAGIAWPIAAILGLIVSGVWNYGVTSIAIWRARRPLRHHASEGQRISEDVACNPRVDAESPFSHS